ncbi:hypothetical protein JZ751_017267 [Albula glossodonta]|uniref:Uncharacterized protein n=1 Tax=Albula glossodonta TaxID=121402 RepID=A0A8T2N051_9TELE|nr:hypothetical protein JZ751_017267 [Albula glossodonta]
MVFSRLDYLTSPISLATQSCAVTRSAFTGITAYRIVTHMASQHTKITAAVACLLLGILAVLLLTIPTEDLYEPPDYMVRFECEKPFL